MEKQFKEFDIELNKELSIMSKEQLTIFWGKVSESARERNLNSFISDFEKKFPGFKDNMCVMKLEKMLKKIDLLLQNQYLFHSKQTI